MLLLLASATTLLAVSWFVVYGYFRVPGNGASIFEAIGMLVTACGFMWAFLSMIRPPDTPINPEAAKIGSSR